MESKSHFQYSLILPTKLKNIVYPLHQCHTHFPKTFPETKSEFIPTLVSKTVKPYETGWEDSLTPPSKKLVWFQDWGRGRGTGNEATF